MSTTHNTSSSASLLGAEAKPVISSKPGKLPSTMTMVSKPIILKKFTLFPKLPVEIKDMIWGYAMINLPPRIVEVEYSTTKDKIIGATLAPPLLHVCSGSRKAALSVYEPLSFGYFSGAHINWSRDTILLNLRNTTFFSTQLRKVNCTDLYQKCTRLIINGNRTPSRSLFEGGDITRADEEWHENLIPPDFGLHIKAPLFGYFEVLREISVTYLGKTPKGDGNLTVEMASDDVRVPGSAIPCPRSIRYKLTQLGYVFPSESLLDQSIGPLTNVRVVKLKRGKEKKMTEAKKIRREFMEKMKRRVEFECVKRVMDERYQAGLWGGDEEWVRKIQGWVEGIPTGAESWSEDWAKALSDFWM
ncbi:hypothetical protein BKA65DRAFT_595005 [Rhexocercosporidium sp. MPI-PUGE-AT-0058]|nr:hypothetical protein BKA65DRAFT_595005 [Rhexocercosporidium sp. MPI-PUGE-AT-0058]